MTALHYIDAFTGHCLPAELRQHVARNLVPRLLRQLGGEGLAAMVSHDLDTVVRTQQASIETRRPMRLFQLVNPEFQPSASPRDTAVLTVHREGVTVAIAALRLKRIGRTLREALAGRSLLYERPEMAPEGEVIRIDGDACDVIRACPIAVSTALWKHPDEKGVDIVRPMMRLLHLWAVAHWEWAWLVGLGERFIAHTYAVDVHGFGLTEMGIVRPVRGKPDPVEYFLMAVSQGRFERIALGAGFDDLSVPLGRPA